MGRLPIFPLPDVVLFPGSSLPLHVFEPRYRRMTEDVLAGSGLMGIVRLAPGYEKDYYGRPTIEVVGALAEVVDSKRLPDGRFALVVVGRERIRVEREHPADRSYREVVAAVLDGSSSSSLELVAAHVSQLTSLCSQLSSIVDDEEAELVQLVQSASNGAELADFLAAVVVEEPSQRQMLLEELDPVARLDFLVEHVAELVARLVPRSSAPN